MTEPGDQPPPKRPGRRSTTADTAAARWGLGHPESDPEHAPHVPEDEDVVPNRHSASAEAAALRWREEHEEHEEDEESDS